MRNYIEFYSNRFKYVGYDGNNVYKYRKYIAPLNELMKNIPVEYNDYKLLCKEFMINWDADFPHLFNNQPLLKEKVCEYFNIGKNV